ncbi:DNA-directed RNA polymerase III, subunit Rpc31 [Dendryphion nanum]|uniref:DNA-directed RNA polymerase III subunit n=1 Tax=Dendryphion nanum TaxID=256645 RepID=A0A9P9EKR8_9PLEO|nr:DNA-directed RNA polymerase III, subunit Rpc31 [Dendryphion nanum]
MPPARGGRGGARGGRGGAFNGRGTVSIGGIELNWDLSGLDIQRAPAERFPKHPVPLQVTATNGEKRSVRYVLAGNDDNHEGPFYTLLNDSMKSGLKRRADEPAPTEASLFNSFMDNQTYTSKYLKVRRRLPKLDSFPYVSELFNKDLDSVVAPSTTATNGESAENGPPTKKRKTIQISKGSGTTLLDRMIDDEETRAKTMEDREDNDEEDYDEEEEKEEDENKPDAVGEEDNWSAASSDSEESGDDYNAEQYFDNGEDDDMDDGDPDDNTY